MKLFISWIIHAWIVSVVYQYIVHLCIAPSKCTQFNFKPAEINQMKEKYGFMTPGMTSKTHSPNVQISPVRFLS